jgi:hypothetical protein
MINFVTETEWWVMRRYCQEFSDRIPGSEIGSDNYKIADVNLFFPHYFIERLDCDTPKIGFFTHREEAHAGDWDRAAALSDWCVTMCDKSATFLPPEKTTVIQVYPDKQFYKEKIVLGIAGFECPSGRKRFDLVDKLREIDGIEVKFADGKVPFDEMPDFYRSVDYIVITADNEGGPMPVIEALALGKPVITPDVGFAWDFPVLKYDTPDDLLRLVKSLVLPKDGWDIAARQLLEVIEKVKVLYRMKHD